MVTISRMWGWIKMEGEGEESRQTRTGFLICANWIVGGTVAWTGGHWRGIPHS